MDTNTFTITVAEAETLTLGELTAIDLKGDSASAKGTIVLKGASSSTEGGTLAFGAATTSLIKTAGAQTKSGTPTIANATLTGLTGHAYNSSNDYLTDLISTEAGVTHTIQATAQSTDVTLGAGTQITDGVS